VIEDESVVQTARVTVNLPADADLWFNGTKMRTTGSIRQFETPPIAGGQSYTYEARARWMENGREVNQTQKIAVLSGKQINVTFPKP